MGQRRGVPALVIVEHLQRFGLAHLVPPVTVDHQVERRAVEEGARVLDTLRIGTLQHPQVGIVGNVLRRLAAAKTRGKKAHQFAIVVFHDVT
ncbi:hypothetical protein D3C76_1394820 [compost metagenome]